MAGADATTRFRESVAWIEQMRPHIDFDLEEITYKIDAAAFLMEARKLLARGSAGWIPAFIAGLRGSNLLSWQTRDNLIMAARSHSGELAELLQLLWAGAERGESFNAFVRGLRQLNSAFTAGIGTTVASVMLMGRSARSYPPFGTQAVRAFWKITHWPSTIGDDPWLNYSNFRASLRRFRDVASAAGLPVADLLTAQGYMWLIVEWDERTVLPAAALPEFRAWRGDPYTGPYGTGDRALGLRACLLTQLADREEPFLTPDELRGIRVDGQPMSLLPARGETASMTEDGSLLALVLPASSHVNALPRNLATDGTLGFPWKTVNRSHPEDKALLSALEDRLPIVVLSPTSDGMFQVLFPVFVSRCIHKDRVFRLDLTHVYMPWIDPATGKSAEMNGAPVYERRWTATTTRSRVHGPAFRRDVLDAYGQRCAVCALNIPCLLDAAHIIPDRDEAGIASATNGLALCKTHHAAFDANLLGVDENLTIHISPTVLRDPRASEAARVLMDFDQRRLAVIPSNGLRPEPASLARKWDEFTASQNK